MTLERMDNVLIVVDDLEAAKALSNSAKACPLGFASRLLKLHC